jgi:alanyl-tRNA synthetase
VRQAGSAVRPDKLRFDFTHGHALSPEDLRAIEDRVNDWILDSRAVRPFLTTRMRAEELGAMALFGEKYGDEVRVIEVDGVSRELCGGTHVGVTSEIALFKIVSEGSSAANVRRIEAVTGPEAVKLMRERERTLGEIASALRTSPDRTPDAVAAALAQRDELERDRRAGDGGALDQQVSELVAAADDVRGVKVLAARSDAADAQTLLELSDRLKGRLGEASAVVLGAASDGRAHLVANFARGATERGLSAVEVVRTAAKEIGGGGGGRDAMAQAGGRHPDKLEQALAVARKAIEAKLS